MSQMTMALLMQLLGHTETLTTDDHGDRIIWQVLRYVESNYVNGSFAELVQAAFLLKNTDRNVADISVAVGYENIRYFHRIFAEMYGKPPKHYRMQEKTFF